ncbi:MAG TPA: hypothetical protein VKE88_00445 [Candidatus Nanoarchaeia archaeon]|nr:hypothetical protein [Candidatus Nanoarchaeia archaeon]
MADEAKKPLEERVAELESTVESLRRELGLRKELTPAEVNEQFNFYIGALDSRALTYFFNNKSPESIAYTIIGMTEAQLEKVKNGVSKRNWAGVVEAVQHLSTERAKPHTGFIRGTNIEYRKNILKEIKQLEMMGEIVTSIETPEGYLPSFNFEPMSEDEQKRRIAEQEAFNTGLLQPWLKSFETYSQK